MNSLQAIWRASLRSTFNTVRFDRRMRVGLTFALLVQLVLSIWALSRLIPMVARWQSQGSVTLSVHLWFICLAAWAVIALFAVSATLIYGLGGDEVLLLTFQPIEPATRLRALYGHVLWRGVGNWLLCEVSVIGLALSLTLGWSALSWLLLLVLNAFCVVWLSMFATLLVVRYVLPHPGRTLLYGAIFVVSDTLVYLLVQYIHRVTADTLLPFGLASPKVAAFLINVLSGGAASFTGIMVSCALLLIQWLSWFPLARRTGLLYLAALQRRQGRDSSPRAFIWPAPGVPLILLKRWRTPLNALLFKGLLQQSRHLFTWVRLFLLIAMLLLFPLLRPSLAALSLNDILQITFYATGIAFLALLEYAPYAIGGEGARLALYLVAPCDLMTFLRARLCSYLLPALLIGWLSTLVLGIWTGLSFFSFLLALALLTLIISGYIVLAVLGSSLDADLTQVAEDKMQTLLLEEFPGTTRRLQLLGLTVLFWGTMLLLCWKLPMFVALSTLLCLNAALFVVGERFSQRYLANL